MEADARLDSRSRSPAPAVTIVTPSFNQGRFLRATIESVLAQDYPHVEYIIMDGGSSDESAAIAAEYSSRLEFLSEPDRGQSHAINKGFARARGEVLAWINSDDLLLPGAVSAAVEALSGDIVAGAVYGEGLRIDESGRTLGRYPFTEPFNLWKLSRLTDYILQQTLYVRRRALAAVGPLDESLHYAMDWDLLIRLGARFPIRHVPCLMGAIREHRAAKSFRGGRARVAEIARVLRRHGGGWLPPGVALAALETWRGPFPLQVITGRLIDRVRREAQGLYRDGWAAPRMRCLVPPGEAPIVIRGATPVRQTFRVRCNGRPAGEWTVDEGSFELTLREPSFAELEIVASSWVCPPSNEVDPRRLAWVARFFGRRENA